MVNQNFPNRPNYFYLGFAVAAGLLILLFALGPFVISIWVLGSLLIIAGLILYKFYRSQNQDRY